MFPLRDDQPAYTPPIVTTLLIIACSLVFFYEISLDEYSRDFFISRYGLVPAHFRPAAVVTSLFLHGGWLHIIGNMLYLWVFGRSLEDAMGHGKFLGFYFAVGIVAGLVHTFFNYDSRLPTVGASGAIAGVMGAYLIKFPRAEIRTLVWIFFFATTVEIPAVAYLVFWFVSQLSNGYGSIARTQVTDSGVAWFAHIGGFVAGMIFVTVMGTRQRYFPRRRDIYW